jgi:hypothetical protein
VPITATEITTSVEIWQRIGASPHKEIWVRIAFRKRQGIPAAIGRAPEPFD